MDDLTCHSAPVTVYPVVVSGVGEVADLQYLCQLLWCKCFQADFYLLIV